MKRPDAPEDLIDLKIQGFAVNRSRELTDKADILTIFCNVPDLNLDRIKEYTDIFKVRNEIIELKKRISVRQNIALGLKSCLS